MNVSVEFGNIIEADIKSVDCKRQPVKVVVDRLKDKEKKFNQQYKSAEKSIIEAGEEIKRKVDEAVNQLLKELSDKKTAAVKRIEDIENQLNLRQAALESYLRYSRELLDNGKPCDITENYSELHLRAEELLKQEQVDIDDCQLPNIIIDPHLYIYGYISRGKSLYSL